MGALMWCTACVLEWGGAVFVWAVSSIAQVGQLGLRACVMCRGGGVCVCDC
jgi:hypothetical protein